MKSLRFRLLLPSRHRRAVCSHLCPIRFGRGAATDCCGAAERVARRCEGPPQPPLRREWPCPAEARSLPAGAAEGTAAGVDSWRRVGRRHQGQAARSGDGEERRRGRQRRIPLQPARHFPGADRGLQGGDPLAARPCQGIRLSRRSRRRVGRQCGRPSRRAARRHRPDARFRCGRESGSIQRHPVRPRLVRSGGLSRLRSESAHRDGAARESRLGDRASSSAAPSRRSSNSPSAPAR